MIRRVMRVPRAVRPGSRRSLGIGLLGVVAVAGGLALSGVRAQVFHMRSGGGTNPFRLGVMNPDGSGEQLLTIELPDFIYPSWADDGRMLAVTSPTPGRPGKQSMDVFGIDPATGRAASLVAFADDVKTEPLPNGQSQTRSSWVLPLYKALSPDRSRIAVWGFVRSAVTQNGGGQITSGVTTTPVLQVFETAGGFLQGTIWLNRQRTGFTQGGDGVDWHPTQTLIVAAIDVDVRVASTGGVAEGCALFLAEPVDGAFDKGKAKRLTNPQGYTTSTLFRTVLSGESDYAPAFSPDGQQVAYFRCLTTLDSDVAGFRRPCEASIRTIRIDGTGDREVLRFQAGIYPTMITWSGDGRQLIFDSGTQLVIEGTPVNASVPDAAKLSVVNVDGTGAHSISAAGRLGPAWRPGTVLQPPAPVGRLDPFVFGENTVQLTLRELATGAKARVEVSPDLKQWGVLQRVTGTGNPLTVTEAGNKDRAVRFYRMVADP